MNESLLFYTQYNKLQTICTSCVFHIDNRNVFMQDGM